MATLEVEEGEGGLVWGTAGVGRGLAKAGRGHHWVFVT